MKALIYHGVGDIRLNDVPEPVIVAPTDAIVRLSASAICGSDLHLARGTVGGVQPGTVIGHEGVGFVEALGADVRNLRVGDRVVIPATIACGECAYCRVGYYAQCDEANPMGRLAGSATFGGPLQSGRFHGLQAERARIPFAHVGLVKLPEAITDDDALLLSDILPTALYACELAEIKRGNTVAIFGCGPVGLMAICLAKHRGAGRILAVDTVDERLDLACQYGAEIIDYEREDPVTTIRRLTGGIGVDRAIDAVGVDANRAHTGPAAVEGRALRLQHQRELLQIAPHTKPSGDNWHPGDAPSQALSWAVRALAKAGTLGIVGVYPREARHFPIGEAMSKGLTIKTGICHHRAYIPKLITMLQAGILDTRPLIAMQHPAHNALESILAFDRRQTPWLRISWYPCHTETPPQPPA
jgi:threonine dehydrogenase-like Zn-dependent dehydrogenase